MAYKKAIAVVAALCFASAAHAASSTDQTSANRALVTEMFQKMFVENQFEKYADTYMASDYIEHDPGSKNGTKALKAYFIDYLKQHPQAATTVRRVIADGDLVAVYCNVTYSPTDKGIEAVDIFRIAKGKVVEHWDAIQPAGPESWPAAYTTADPNPTAAQTAANKALVKEMFNVSFEQERIVTEADKYIAKDFIEHNPGATNGVEGLKAYFTKSYKDYPKQSTEMKRMAVDGDFAIVNFHFKMSPEERGFAGVDIFRIANGKIAEHWDVVQPVPEKSANDNTMF